jgi:protein O-GlcNAc transferase
MAKKKKIVRTPRTLKLGGRSKTAPPPHSTYEEWKPYMPQWLGVIRAEVDLGNLQKAKEMLKALLAGGVQEKLEALKDLNVTFFSYYELSILCYITGLHKEALESCLRAVKIKPMAGIFNQIGLIYRSMNECSLAIENLQKAKQLDPEDLNVRNNLAMCLMKVGQSREAIELFRESVGKDPLHTNLYPNLLLHLNYIPGVESSNMYQEAQKWAQLHVPPSLAWNNHNNDPNPDRKLRIGYISPDFKRHSVMFFFNSLMSGHDRGQFELYGYGNVEGIDEVTKTTSKKFDCYRNIKGIDDKTVAQIIKEDHIDILVEMAGFTKGNSLRALAHKPAPIQVSYLGYPNTTGMSQIDYRFTDAIADTPDQQQYYTEKLVYLPHGFLCYDPGSLQPEIKELPFIANKHITFGCSNNISKLTPEMMKLWVQILNSVPRSKIILKFAEAADQKVKNHYYDKFQELGLSDAKEKVALIPWLSHAKHMEMYNYVDIALDTYPYNGTTTTCQALLMGVPVITLTGKHHASRVGLDILSRIGMEFFSAVSAEDYVKKAVALASKPDALTKIRSTMRQRLAASPLCNYRIITGDIENAYRQMWRQWCQSRRPGTQEKHSCLIKTPDLTVDDITFSNLRTTFAKDITVGFNDSYVIKIEHGKHPWKLRSFAEEIEIIKHLNASGCVSCPKLVGEGKLKTGERYFIQERVHNRRGFNVADMLFSILEQKSFGVCQGDFKRDNFIFGGDSICHIIDYDQAIYDEKFIPMGNIEYLEWFNRFFIDRWTQMGLNLGDIYRFAGVSKDQVMALFKNDAFNLAETSIFEEQLTTASKGGIYHSLTTDRIYIEGERDLKSRTPALNSIDFRPGEKVLDVGCNMGLLSHYLHDRGCKVTGIDMDEKIITGAQMVANILNKDIQFRYLDVDNTRIEEEYDTVCLFSVIHHVKYFATVTQNIAEKCNRIIFECRQHEAGLKPVQGQWYRSSGWDFNCSHELITYLEQVFKGFKFYRHHGCVDRSREIMTFVKEPAMVIG